MDEQTKLFWTRLIGSRLTLPASGEFFITGVNCNSIYVSKSGEESTYKISIDGVKTDVKADENSFLKILEEDTHLNRGEVLQMPKTRKGEYKEFRFLHIYFRNVIMRRTLESSAAIYGKDHATTLHIVKTLRNWIKIDRSFREKYQNTINYMKEIKEDAFD